MIIPYLIITLATIILILKDLPNLQSMIWLKNTLLGIGSVLVFIACQLMLRIDGMQAIYLSVYFMVLVIVGKILFNKFVLR